MKLETWDIADAGCLASFYNRLVADASFCPPVTEEAFVEGFRFRRSDCLTDERIHVATDSGKVVGFAHIAQGPPTRQNDEIHGIVRFLLYEPGCRPAGQALLETVESDFRSAGLAQIWAFTHDHAYRFYQLGFGLLSDCLLHVKALFGMNAYQTRDDWYCGSEVFLERRDYSITEPVLPDSHATVTVEEKSERSRLPGLVILASRGDTHIGECESCSAGEFVDEDVAQETFFTMWLGVEEDERKRGWGRYLLRRTLWEMKRRGFRHAVISTHTLNHRAQLLYANEGYRVADMAYGMLKILDTDSSCR